MPLSFSETFQTVGLIYGLLLPLGFFVLMALLALPAMLRPGMNIGALIKAIYACLGQTFGIMLMTAGGLPALHSVLSQNPLSPESYLGLLLVFATGGIVYLMHDSLLRTIDAPSKLLPATMLYYTWKFLGLFIAVLASLSLVLQLLAYSTIPAAEGWWAMHVVMLAYGLILSWFTLPSPARPVSPFQQSVQPINRGVGSVGPLKKKLKGKA